MAGYNVEEVAHFLRLVYHPEGCDLKQLGRGITIVPGVAKLAPSWDAPKSKL